MAFVEGSCPTRLLIPQIFTSARSDLDTDAVCETKKREEGFRAEEGSRGKERGSWGGEYTIFNRDQGGVKYGERGGVNKKGLFSSLLSRQM